MSNKVEAPVSKESGLYKDGFTHKEGGIAVLVDGVKPVETEVLEYLMCGEAYDKAILSNKVYNFKNKTNLEMLDEIFKDNSCSFQPQVAKSGDFILCRKVVLDKKRYDRSGNTKDILNDMQAEKSCNVSEDAKEDYGQPHEGGNKKELGGTLTAKEKCEARLEILKRIQRKKPTKEMADKIRKLKSDMRKGIYDAGEEVKKEEPKDYRPELIAIHNLDYSNILFADKLGGISMPSLAIVKITNPITNFGNITLVASKDFVDPQKNHSAKVFNRDIYSPSYPRIYSHVDKYALSKLESDFYEKKREWSKYADEAIRYSMSEFIEDLKKGKHLPDVLGSSVKNKFIVYLWAKENNVDIEVPLKPYQFSYWEYNPATDPEFISGLKAKYPVLYNAVMDDTFDFGNEELKKQLSDAFKENYKKKVEKLDKESDEEYIKVLNELLSDYYDENGNLIRDYEIFKALVPAVTERKVVDTEIFDKNIEKISKEHEHEIREFVKKKIDKVMWGSYFFRTKTSKAETTLDNIYDYMVGKGMKSSQETIVYGLGKAAALSAKEYDSLTAVARDKDHYTVTKEQFEEYKKKQDELWEQVRSKIRPYYKDSNEMSFDALNDLSKAMGQISQLKNPTDERINSILSKNGYGKTPSYVYDSAREFADLLRNAPAEYFEVKMKDIVKLESFIGAAVPVSLYDDVAPLLNKHGIKNIVTYDNTNYEEKQKNLSDALYKIVEKSSDKILFEKGGTTTLEPTKDKELIGMHLPIEMSVYVPSTKNANEPVSKEELDARVNEVRQYLASMFGGFSSSDVTGGYVSNSKELIKEDVVKVIAFATKEAYEENKEKLAHQVAKWASDWSQEAIGFELEGDLYYINQETKMEKGGCACSHNM